MLEDIDVSHKKTDLEKRKKDELKKVQKLCRKELHEIEDISNGKNAEERVRMLKDRIKKSITDMQKVKRNTSKMGNGGETDKETELVEKDVAS